jgi:hypothetical protein
VVKSIILLATLDVILDGTIKLKQQLRKMTRRNERWKVVALKRLVFFCRLLLRSTTTGRYNNNNNNKSKKQRKRDVGNVAVECCCCRRNNNGAGSRQNYFPASFGVAQLCPRPLYAPGIRNGNLFSFCFFFFFFFFFTTLYLFFENKTNIGTDLIRRQHS